MEEEKQAHKVCLKSDAQALHPARACLTASSPDPNSQPRTKCESTITGMSSRSSTRKRWALKTVHELMLRASALHCSMNCVEEHSLPKKMHACFLCNAENSLEFIWMTPGIDSKSAE
eukprot:1157409-Pelagomonas_calceolata.AAC.11